MRLGVSLVRQVLAAALLLSPVLAQADIAARFDVSTGAVIVTGLDQSDEDAILADPSLIRLQSAETPAARGTLMTVTHSDENLRVTPRFALRDGARYSLSIALPDNSQFETEFSLPGPEAATPRLVGFAPPQAVIPANTLRFYLTFSEPMERGQVRDAITLVRDNGQPVPNPFLNLETELWDNAQKRLTLILDPGRIKQGVGPNSQVGAPLDSGKRYRLVVSGAMRSALGAPLGSGPTVAFRAGPPERRPVNPDTWEIMTPQAKGHTPFSVTFDRIMDSSAALRRLRLYGPDGDHITGQFHTDGGGWSLTPNVPWKPGQYRLVVDTELEDVAGNTIRAAFDAEAGTMGKSVPPASIEFRIGAR